MRPTYFQKLALMDWTLFLVMIGLSISGIAFIYSATYTNEIEEFRNSYRAQMMYIPVGLLGFLVLSLIDYKIWVKYALIIAAIALVGLILVHIAGTERYGQKNWIRLAGAISIQPSELAKIAFIFFLAWYLLERSARNKEFSTFISVIAITLIPVLLILRQPDLGSAAVFLPVALAMMFIAGIRLRYLLIILLAGVGLFAFCYFGIYRANLKIPKVKEYQLARIKMFFNPSLDPKGRGWQINQSLIAIGSGGMSGKGYLKGTQNVLGYLPKKTSYNDFIFSVIGEEWGFVGAASVICMEGLLLLLCLRAAASARDQAGCLITVGIMAMLFTHIFINIGMSIQVVPITGIPLPFISYGGTFLVVCMSAIGVVQSVWIHRKIPNF